MPPPRGGGIAATPPTATRLYLTPARTPPLPATCQLPKWADIVKTGCHKELAPYDQDWYYTRAAAIARKIYLQPGLGVGALKRKFGGSKNRGTRTYTFGTVCSVACGRGFGRCSCGAAAMLPYILFFCHYCPFVPHSAPCSQRPTRTPISHRQAAGGIIRNILQQLEEIKVVEKAGKGGRVISRVGQVDLDRIAGQVAQGGGDGDEESDADSDADSDEE